MSAVNEEHIPYVDSRLSKSELSNYELSEHEQKLEINGEKFSLYIMDFRKDLPNGEKAKDYPIDMYTMGFMETDPVKPNELSAAIIERTKERGGVLIVPRFADLPHNPASAAEAELTIAGLQHLEAQYKELGIDFDLASRDVDIIGFSDGGRSAVELAGLVEKIPPQGTPKRTLRSLSPTSVIDLIDVPENANGNELIKGFTKQVTWITLEETRMRMNQVLSPEVYHLNNAIHEKMADGRIQRGERDLNEIVQREIHEKDDDGHPLYPFLAQGLHQIDTPRQAYDARTMAQVAVNLGNLLKTSEGRSAFAVQFKESMDLNIPFLTDVIERAITANPNLKVEDFTNGKFYNAVGEMIKLYPALQRHVMTNETRSPVVDGLSTFDVDVVFPVEDIVFPAEGYGRTIRRQLEQGKGDIADNPDPNLMHEIEDALTSGDNKRLGLLCEHNPEVFARVLYPHAKSVKMRFTGEFGQLSGTHLAPLKRPEEFGIE